MSNLNFKFSVIGLTETKISTQKSLVSNVSIDGYHFFTQPSHQNALIYRHPKSTFDSFNNYLTEIMDKISSENKYCILMADFNVNLLNCESHAPTEQFINNLTAYCF